MNFEHFFHKQSGKRVKVTMTDGEEFEGVLSAYISAADNDPDPESVIIGATELYTDEIKSIEVVNL